MTRTVSRTSVDQVAVAYPDTDARVSRRRDSDFLRWVARHQLLSFFLLTYVISWTITFAVKSVLDGLYAVAPFIVAVALTTVGSRLEPVTTVRRRVTAWAAVTVALYPIWILTLHYFAQKSWHAGWVLGGVLDCAVVAWLLTAAWSSRLAVRALLARLYAWRVGWGWYAFAVLFWPAAYGIGMALDAGVLGGKAPDYPYAAPSVAGVLLVVVWTAIWGGGLEEVGWRGYALPRLQTRYSPLIASLIVGFFWALWHTPEYFTGQYTSTSGTGPAAIVGILARFSLYTPPLAVLLTWMYNRTSGNLLLPVLAHTSFNVGTAALAISTTAYLFAFLILWVTAVSVVAADRMWRHPPADTAGNTGTTH